MFEIPNEMLIGDLIIVDSDELLDRTKSRWQTLWQKVFKPQPIKYRNRGLGTCLLNFVIDSACRRGIKRIDGTITQQDVANTPGLTDWYKKHPFQVELLSSKDSSTAIAKISMELR